MVARSRAVVFPILLVPIIFFVVLPAGLIVGVRATNGDMGNFDELLARMPEAFRAEVTGLSPQGQLIFWALEYAFVTLFLIVPLMTSAVIAADSFAGEKERKTLEALIYTPTTDLELYAGKVIAPWLAAVAIGTIGFACYAIVANVLAGGIVGRVIVFTPRWLLMVGIVAPGVAALGVAALVQVSARVRGFQEAYQLGGLVVLPVVVLIVGQLGGAVYLGTAVVAALGIVVWVVAAVAIAIGYRSFRRERLLLSA